MPGTQPRGTHAFNPDGSSSQAATQELNVVNAEADGPEDQIGPPLDSPMANIPAASAASLIPPDFDINPFRGRSSVASSSRPLPDPTAASSSSHGTKPPPSSSLPPSVHSHPTQQCHGDISMSSVHSITTGSDATDAGSGHFRKRKHDTKSMGGTQPPSAKRSSKSKNDDLNPVIISNALNSTLNRIADVMERSLDVTAAANAAATANAAAAANATPVTAPTISVAPPSTITSPIEFQTTQLSSTPSQPLGPPSNSSSASVSPADILDQAIRIVSAGDSGLSEDEIFSASLFFTTASDDAIRAARTFVALCNNRVVQHRFLLRQLETAALLPGKGKGKAVEDDDHFMVY